MYYKMKQGYDVFGKAYGIMLRNDLHAIGSVDHELLKNMILLNEESYNLLYKNIETVIDMREHELYYFAQHFKGDNEHQTIINSNHNDKWIMQEDL